MYNRNGLFVVDLVGWLVRLLTRVSSPLLRYSIVVSQRECGWTGEASPPATLNFEVGMRMSDRKDEDEPMKTNPGIYCRPAISLA